MHLSELVDMCTGCTVYDQFSYMYFWWSWWSLQAKTHWSKNEVVLHTTNVAEATSASSAVFGSASSVIPRQIPLKLHATGLYAKVTVKAVRPLYHGHEACSSRSRWQCCCWAQNLLCVLCVTDCKTSQEERGETVTTTWKNHFSFWGPSCCCLWHALVVTFICTKTAETVSQWLICPNRTKISRPSVLSSAHVEKSEKTFLDWTGTFSNSSLMGGVKWDDTHSAASLPISMASFTVATPSFTMTESVSP